MAIKTEINFGETVSLAEATQIIMTMPDIRVCLRGEPGIGKSSVLSHIGKTTGMDTAYIDVPNMDLGDIAMPVIDHESKVTRYYPNARFKFHKGTPVAVMLDEFTKGSKPVRDMLHPLLEVVNPRLGDLPIPDGGLVFMTGNLGSDGVGDNMAAHTRARIVELVVRKPSSEEWLGWADRTGRIDPVMMACARRIPSFFASYLDGDMDNEYIYNPRKGGQNGYVCPRTLEIASNIIKRRHLNSRDAITAALSGALGKAAGKQVEAFVSYADQLPDWEDIFRNPLTAPVPELPGACAIVAYGGIQMASKDNLDALMQYIERFDAEWQATFCISLAKNTSKQHIAFSCQRFTRWVAKNEALL